VNGIGIDGQAHGWSDGLQWKHESTVVGTYLGTHLGPNPIGTLEKQIGT
jgi:hypothetical protein